MAENHYSTACLVSIGCNTDCERQILCARERLTEAFPGVVFTDAIVSPAYEMPEGTPPYSNCIAAFSVEISENELVAKLKRLEHELGDTLEQRQRGVVMIDIDLLEYGGMRRHEGDWQRPYVKSLLSKLRAFLLLFLFFFTAIPFFSNSATASSSVNYATKDTDAELLGKAVEYYQGSKYHEAVIAFEKLQQRYKLNPRFKAYLGMCYFKEQQYQQAADNLKVGIPELTAYSPREQAYYIYSCAESLFHLRRYKEALTYFEMAMPLTEGNDKGDVLFHTAFSYYLMEDAKSAMPFFKQAKELYRQHTRQGDDLHTARLKQTEVMLRGLEKLFPPPPDELPTKAEADASPSADEAQETGNDTSIEP